ncbi:MAG: hypothetical protein ACLFVJ_03925 [Persicimonas sp.]
MGKEVKQGILGGLVAIVIVVSIGSFIAAQLSHGSGHEGGAEQHAPADDQAPADEQAPEE